MKPTISKPFKSNDRTFDKVYNAFDKRDYFNSQGLAKTQIGNFERALQKNDKGAQQVLDLFKGDEKKAKDYITQVISDRNKERAFNNYKALKSAVDSIQKGKPNVGAVDYVKRIIHNSSQKYSIALYSTLRNKKFTKWKDVHNDIDSLIGEGFASDAQRRAAFASGYKAKGKKKNESVNESTVNEGFSNLKISGPAYDLWNDRKVQRKLRGVKIRIVGDMDGVLTVRGNDNELQKVKDINLCCIESVNESNVNEAKKEIQGKHAGNYVKGAKAGRTIEINGITYTCLGKGKWKGPDGKKLNWIEISAMASALGNKKVVYESVNEANTIGKMAKRYKNKDKFISAFFTHMKKHYGDSFKDFEKDKKYRDNIAKIWDDVHGVKESVNELSDKDIKKAEQIRKSMPGFVGPKFAKKASNEDILAFADLQDKEAEIYNSKIKPIRDAKKKLYKKYRLNLKESVNEAASATTMKVMQNKYDRQGYSLKQLHDEVISYLGKKTGGLVFQQFIRKNKSNKKVQDEFNKTSFSESVNEAYVVLYSPKKGVKPVTTAAYKDKKDAEKWAKDLGGITMIVKKKVKGIGEGKKRYYQQDRVGSAKYTISYHDGKKKHKDGSDFFDIQTFKNKKDLAKFVNTLHKGGYVYGFNEEVPQGYNPMVEDKNQIIQIKKKVGKSETKFYDTLSTIEKKLGKRKYRIWLEKSLKDFGENPKHYDYRTNASIEEKLFQVAK